MRREHLLTLAIKGKKQRPLQWHTTMPDSEQPNSNVVSLSFQPPVKNKRKDPLAQEIPSKRRKEELDGAEKMEEKVENTNGVHPSTLIVECI
jgi:hypothetical protein